ncbi:hypothetical protein BDP27DRAFT_1413021 [Rhodocollybia butyracea]|uniref:Myb/SANT-like domain-containing protein n=1 Tax=Rhodocollybia butyracea TaxID=206335 RepID=A0A9P5QAD7_9AGAR|nr:hypothetical protein BDP27DRAFT_1413021 [Rhodocollybia butyracea]
MSQPTSDPRSGSNKAGIKKASWSAEDDQILIETLTDQKAGGFQMDNGGFHGDAHKATAAKPASSTSEGAVKTSDSCRTCWTTLKKDFRDVQFIRGKSSFGWDAKQNIATAPSNIWKDLIKAKPKLKKW